MKAYNPLIPCAAIFAATFAIGTITAEEAPSRSATEARIATLEKQIEAREKRATELTNDMLALDDRTETRVDSILQSLEGISDSRETQDKVADIKRKAMVALRTCTKHYESKRKAVSEEIKKTDPRVTREDLFGDLGKFDDRIQKRIDQVIGLTSSLQQPEDYERWSFKHQSGLGSIGDDDAPRDPNFYRNRRIAKKTGKMREKLESEFKASITRLDKENRELGKLLAGDVSEEYREALESEIEANQKRIDGLQADIADVTAPQKKETTPIGRKQKGTVENLVRDMAEDLERDCDAVFRIYRELNQERKALRNLRVELGEQQALLK